MITALVQFKLPKPMTPDKAQALLKAVRSAIRIPLTIKIRSGWEASGQQALNIARIAEDCGVELHAGLSRAQTKPS